MFYFGLDSDGLINSHILDRKISNFRPSSPVVQVYPWLKTSSVAWNDNKVYVPQPNYATNTNSNEEGINTNESIFLNDIFQPSS
jgi:hypothetical protein